MWVRIRRWLPACSIGLVDRTRPLIKCGYPGHCAPLPPLPPPKGMANGCMQAVVPSFPTGTATQKAHDATTKKWMEVCSKPDCEVLSHGAVEARGDVVIGMLDNVQRAINTWGARLRAPDMEAKKEHMQGGIGSNQGAVELSGLLSGEAPVTELQKRDDLRPHRDEQAARDAVAAGRLRAGLVLSASFETNPPSACGAMRRHALWQLPLD